MFERYLKKTRRVIFYARWEASESGSPEIESEHLLLGLLREAKGMFVRLKIPGEALSNITEACRQAIPRKEKIPTSVDLPLSARSRIVLAVAMQAADFHNQRHIAPEHLLAGVIDAGGAASEILKRHGLSRNLVDALLASEASSPVETPSSTRERLNLGHAEGCVEFLCRGTRVGIAAMPLANPLPRVGEEVVINRNGAFVSYKVLEVTYVFEKYPEWAEHAPQRLTKIVVKVEDRGDPGENDFSLMDYT